MIHYSEQEIIRREKKRELEKLGVLPYPSNAFCPNTTAKHIVENFSEVNSLSYKNVAVVGRLLSMRIMGAASFIEIEDQDHKIQIYVARDSIAKSEDKSLYNTIFKKLLDIGDIIGIEGYVFTTNVGVTSIHAENLVLLSKSLKPLPIVKEVTDAEGNKKTFDAFSDVENRYRERYLDLIVNKDVKKIFYERSKIFSLLRNHLSEKGFLEVETPILQPVYGGAAAKPFTTHHNTLDMQLYLRISPELYLKRLIVGGYNGVFEIAKNFRNEGMSRFHNPEFTMLELYVAYKDYLWMADYTEDLICSIVHDLHGKSTITVNEKEINFEKPWKRYSLYDVIKEFTGIDISKMDENQLLETSKSLNIHVEANSSKAKIIDEIFGEKCEPFLINPTFITDYPVEMSPLAKKKKENPELVERFEIICNGKEICNAYSELNDPIDQRERFEEQLKMATRGDKEAMMLDEDFINALEYGMPPTAGLGIGLDRLVMILTNSKSIQDVLFFPQMRPK